MTSESLTGGPSAADSPASLHAVMGSERVLDWGERIPTREEIAWEFGEDAARRALEILRDQVLPVEPRLTAELVAAVPDGATLHRLGNRVKSPASLARKVRYADRMDKSPVIRDALRYTVVSSSAADQVGQLKQTVDELVASGWRVDQTHHSYVDGSRYKGIHVNLTAPGGVRAEVQFHSPPSIAVKEATTGLYEIERDARRPDAERTAARNRCVALSDGLALPAGLDELTELHGVPVEVRSYVDSQQVPRGQAVTSTGRSPREHGRQASRDGMER